MKLPSIAAMFLLACLTSPVVAVDAAGPIQKVVELIKELKAKIEADEETETKIYNKYACWCEITSDRKAKVIEEAKKRIEELGNEVMKLKGRIATLASEIAEKLQQIEMNEKEQAEATALRQKENKAFLEEKSEMEQAIAALEKAIIVLGGAHGSAAAGSASASLVQSEMDILKVAAAVSHAVDLLPAGCKLEPEKLSLVTQFTKDPTDFAQVATAGGRSKYNPASSTILGILKDMYATFSSDLEAATGAEAQAQKNYEDLMATKAKELDELKKILAKKQAQKAEADKNLADASEELATTTAQMKEDTAFFDEMKGACTEKSNEWAERSKLRKEELEGINKAIELLTSDEARELLSRAIKPGKETFFLQLGQGPAPAEKAFQALKRAAAKTHSLRLASLAASVRSSSAGAFEKVINAIDEMMGVLKEEEQKDIEQRDMCRSDTFRLEQEKSRHEYKIEKTEAKITKLNEKLDGIVGAMSATVEEIKATQEEIEAMKATREEERSAFEGAKTDDEGAIELLEKAIEHLSGFYKKNDVDMGPIQGSAKLLQEPEFAVSPDQAPDAQFSDKGNNKNQSKGIISILTMLVEDLKDELANGQKAEDAAIMDHERAVHTAKELISTLETKMAELETNKSETEDAINGQEEIQSQTAEELAGVKEELALMKPNCDWLLGAFENRRTKRAAEMDGLLTAKEYLAGAAPAPSASLLAKKGLTFDDNKLDEINFTNVSFLQRRAE